MIWALLLLFLLMGMLLCCLDLAVLFWGYCCAWACHDQTTLTANNNALKISLISGRYKVNVAAVMVEETCNVSAFEAGDLVNSQTYVSNEFMVINHDKLDFVDGNSVAQAFLHQDPEMLYGTYLTSYDLQLKWAALEGTVSTVCALTDVPLPIARH
jgi:hypothetical protein